jgi:hypothetical protein
MSETTGRTVGPWQDRVAFSPEGGGVAYRPGEVYVRSSDAERAEGFLGRERDAESGSFTRVGTEQERWSTRLLPCTTCGSTGSPPS